MHHFLKNMGMKNRASHDYSFVRTSEEDSKDGLLEERIGTHEPRPSFWHEHGKMMLFYGSLFMLYILQMLYMTARIRSLSVHGPDLIKSPASGAIFWEEQTFVLGDRISEKSVFSGRPSPAVDKAWHDLLDVENVRIPPETIKRLGREATTVKIPGEDAYLGTLNVYHEIHCLKRIHQYMYQDIYFPGITEFQKEMNRLHNEHCIDFLRQAALCHGDIGLITYEWKDTELLPVANATSHQCVNWNKLEQWSRDRTVDVLKPGWLVHPTLGPAYPDGQGDPIGAATGMLDHTDRTHGYAR